jgi:hypothetical protein
VSAVLVDKAALGRLLDAAGTASELLDGCPDDEVAEKASTALSDAAAAIRWESPAPAAPTRISKEQREADWIANRVQELWMEPRKVCDALERLFVDGCSAGVYPDSAKAHRAARQLRDGQSVALVLLLRDVVQARLTDVARDEWDELS